MYFLSSGVKGLRFFYNIFTSLVKEKIQYKIEASQAMLSDLLSHQLHSSETGVVSTGGTKGLNLVTHELPTFHF